MGARSVCYRLTCMLLLALPVAALAQEPGLRPVEVDQRGIMRWVDDKSEVALFGVNYTAPFAYAYRAFGYVNADRKAAIDMDVSHIARLGLDAYRIHVWDRLVSDSTGNLLENDHLDLLDYLISRLEQRGIHVILTPIFWGGAGYPERDPPTPGFSNRFSKGGMTVDTLARRIQQNYFTQFVRHVNKYTSRSYSDDPGLIAIELFNEPDHPGKPEEQTQYINDLVGAVRAAGFRKPILYNVSQGWSQAHAKAVCSADVQGVTFQWYPTGLVRGSDIRTNMLPNVDSYPIPDTPECANKARLVYEFDAADMLGSYMYPAIARSFRAAGMQWATQFAYDPGAIAFANTEYQTHYLNLLYTPGKAISLLIAAEAFRRLPRLQHHGVYPGNTRFDDFRVSYAEELSELNTTVAFYYSNDTRSQPVRPAMLRHVAGVGSSAVVEYEGTGAYFLDRLDAGVWRLEVYPDALPLRDAFGRNAIEREVTRLVARDWPLRIRLPELGERYHVTGLNSGNGTRVTVASGTFTVTPGVYLLSRSPNVADKWRNAETRAGNRALGEFVAPVKASTQTTVVHRASTEVSAARPLPVSATVVSATQPSSVQLEWRLENGSFSSLPMQKGRGYEYTATIPASQLRAGTLEYRFTINGAIATDSLFRVRVARASDAITLYDAGLDAARMLYPHPWQYVKFNTSFVPAPNGSQAFHFSVESLQPSPHQFAMRAFLGEEKRARFDQAGAFGLLRVRARAAGTEADSMSIAVVQRDGTAWGGMVRLTPEWSEVSVPLAALRRVPLALLPRPYPHFLPEELTVESRARSVNAGEIDGVQFGIKADFYEASARNKPRAFEVERIQLERSR